MENQKILSAFSYLSIFFAPFIVPLIVFFVSKDGEVKRHSIRALLSHVIPVLAGIIFFLTSIFFSTMSFDAYNATTDDYTLLIVWIVAFAIYLIVSFGIVIWNIIQAVRVIR